LKVKFRLALNVFWWINFLSSFTLLYEVLIFTARSNGSFWSQWTFLATVHILIVVESEIFFFKFLSHTNWWLNTVIPFWQKLTKNNKSGNGNDMSKHPFANLIKDLEYLGLTLSAVVINLSKLGAFLFVTDEKKLPYGRLFLYIGCLLRAPFEYYGLSLLLWLKDLVF